MKRAIKWLRNNAGLFLALAFFEPYIFVADYYSNLKTIDNFYSILKIAAFLYAIVFLVCNRNSSKIKKILKPLVSLIILQMIIIVSTIINNGDLTRGLGHSITMLAAFMTGAIIYSSESSGRSTNFLRKYLLLCLVINFISIIIVDTNSSVIPSDIQGGVYFWGIDKRFAYLYLPLIFFEALYELERFKKIKPRFYLLLIVLLASIIDRSKTTIFGIAPFFIVTILQCKRIHPYLTILVYSVVNYFIAYASGLGDFSNFIENVLHKNMTFSGRTFIWEAAQDSYLEHPLLGIGYQTNDYDARLFSSRSPNYAIEYTSMPHAHNVLIDTLYRGGILACGMYLLFWAELLKKSACMHDRMIKVLFFVFILTVLLVSVFDNFDIASIFFIYGIIGSYNISPYGRGKVYDR